MTRRFLCTCMDTAEEIIAADDQKVHHCTTLLMMYVVREVLQLISSYMHIIWIKFFSADLNLDIEEGW